MYVENGDASGVKDDTCDNDDCSSVSSEYSISDCSTTDEDEEEHEIKKGTAFGECLSGKFVEKTGTIRSCDSCAHYIKNTSSVTNTMLKDRCFKLSLKETCVSSGVINTSSFHVCLLTPLFVFVIVFILNNIRRDKKPCVKRSVR